MITNATTTIPIAIRPVTAQPITRAVILKTNFKRAQTIRTKIRKPIIVSAMSMNNLSSALTNKLLLVVFII